MTGTQRWKTLVCFVLIHVAALSGSATEIHLKQRVDSQGSVVLLGDIANLKEGKPDSPRASDGGVTDAASLARIELFPAPSVSRSRTIRRREIRELLSLHGVDMKKVSFAGAESVIVQSTKRPQLQNVARSTNRSIVTTGQPFSNAKPIELANRQVSEPATELVLAPVQNLKRGEIIRQSNVALIRIPVSGNGSAASLGIRPIAQTEEVIGMVTMRPIAANQPLDIRSLQRRLVVRKNDLVTVTSWAPGVSVETVARAVDSGALGDLVVLESLVNRRKYTAHVTGDKTAAVYASGIKVSSPPARQTKRGEPSPSKQRTAR